MFLICLSALAEEKQNSKTLLETFGELCIEEVNSEKPINFCYEGCIACDHDIESEASSYWEQCERCKNMSAKTQESCVLALKDCFSIKYWHCMMLKISLK